MLSTDSCRCFVNVGVGLNGLSSTELASILNLSPSQVQSFHITNTSVSTVRFHAFIWLLEPVARRLQSLVSLLQATLSFSIAPTALLASSSIVQALWDSSIIPTETTPAVSRLPGMSHFVVSRIRIPLMCVSVHCSVWQSPLRVGRSLHDSELQLWMLC